MRNELTGDVRGVVVQAGPVGHLEVHQVAPASTAADGTPPKAEVFAGRERELARLAAADEMSVISGLPGVGKTELLLHYAHHHRDAFPGGVLFVDLHGYDPDRRVSPGRALSSFLRALGVRGEEVPPEESARAALYRSLMAKRSRTLVLLDNASSTAGVEPLLPGVPGHRVVVSSRHTLASLDDAEPVELDVLDPLEAAALVGDAELAELCGRLPLALRIMSALMSADPDRPVEEWRAELRDSDNRLDLLDDGDSRAVHAAFALSRTALDHDQKRLFRLLALHPGDRITVDCTAALADLPVPRTRKLLRQLRAAHLLAGPPYRFHDLVLLYARRCLADEPDAERSAALERVVEFYRVETGSRNKEVLQRAVTDERAEALRWLDEHRTAIVETSRIAFGSGRDRAAVEIAKHTYDYFNFRRHLSDWLDVQETAVDAARRLADPRALVVASNCLSTVYRHLLRTDDAARCARESLRLAERLGDEKQVGISLTLLGAAHRNSGRFEEALTCFLEALRVEERSGTPYGLGIALTNLGTTSANLGRFDEAIGFYQRSLAVRRGYWDDHGRAITLHELGEAHLAKGELDQAVDRVRESLDITRARGNRHGEGLALTTLGRIHHRRGALADAERAYRSALEAFGGTGGGHVRRVEELLAAVGR